MARIEAARHYDFFECESVREYGERELSLSAREAMDLAAIGRALALFEGLEDRVLDGRTSAEAAAVLARLGSHPDALREDDPKHSRAAWLVRAQETSANVLRKMVEHRLSEVDERKRSFTRTIRFDEQGIQDLQRTRELASPSEREVVGPSEAVGLALRQYVKTKDMLERKEGTRRMGWTGAPSLRPAGWSAAELPLGTAESVGPTEANGAVAAVLEEAQCPEGRAVPASVERIVYRRAGNKCRLPYCDNTLFLDKVHVFRDHAEGGSREKDNIDLHCKRHHFFQGEGRIENRGDTEQPRFVNARGESLHVRRLARGRGTDPPLASS
jgi:Arc/MetJ family transcription regulator